MSRISGPRLYLVTGSASGIGRATVAYLRAEGHAVIGADLKDADITADLAAPKGRAALVEQARGLAGDRLDAVVACAGVFTTTALTVQVNFFGVVATLEGLRPLLATGTEPRAVAISSLASLHPVDPEIVDACLAGDEAAAVTAATAAADRGEGYLIYSSSKAALARWVRRTAVTSDWAAAGIPLNAIGPGTITTPMTQGLLDDPVWREIVDETVPMPLNGHARAEQVAPLLSWLAGPENTHVTGQVVFIDGGADATLRGDSTW